MRSEEFKLKRRHLFDLLDAVDGPAAAARFQRELAAAIMEAESLKAQATDRIQRSTYGLHNQMCRAYGDAMVWNMLHRHTIRQLSKAEGRPPHLSGMADVVEKYLEMIELLAEDGVFAFAPDLTNIIRISDVAVVSHHEVPMLLELKGELVYMMVSNDSRFTQSATILKPEEVSGRLARQLHKMSKATEYLATGLVTIAEVDREMRTVEVDSDPEHYWPEVEEAVQGALEYGDCVVIINKRHRLWATSSEPGEVDPPAELSRGMPKDDSLRVGCHLVALEDVSPHIMPPFTWSMSAECRFALMEGEIVVNHIVHLSLLQGHKSGDAKIIQAPVDDPELGTEAAIVEVDGEEVRISSLYSYRLIYEFQKIESVADCMLQSAVAVIDPPYSQSSK